MSTTILVVDDSATVRQQIRLALAPAGYQIVEASDGLQGLEMIRARPDLAMVICDVNMPNMNGIEMLRNVAKEAHSVPVIMLTTEGNPALIRQARASGAKGWIIKPFNAELLVRAVAKIAA